MEWERKTYYGKEEAEQEEDFLNLDSTAVDLTTQTIPVRKVPPKTTEPRRSRVQSSGSGNIVGTLVKIVLLFALLIIGSSIYSSIKKGAVRIDTTPYLSMTENEIADGLGMTFEDIPKEESDFNQYSNGIPKIKGNEDLAILYLDNRLTGVKIKNKKYTAFNVEIGKTHAESETNMTYQYEDYFFILDDKPSAYTLFFYYNETNNDCLVLMVDKAYNRVVSIEYYSNYKKISQNLTAL